MKWLAGVLVGAALLAAGFAVGRMTNQQTNRSRPSAAEVDEMTALASQAFKEPVELSDIRTAVAGGGHFASAVAATSVLGSQRIFFRQQARIWTEIASSSGCFMPGDLEMPNDTARNLGACLVTPAVIAREHASEERERVTNGRLSEYAWCKAHGDLQGHAACDRAYQSR